MTEITFKIGQGIGNEGHCVKCGATLNGCTVVYDDTLGGSYHAGPTGSCRRNLKGRIALVDPKYVKDKPWRGAS